MKIQQNPYYMKKISLFAIAAIVVMTTLMFQGCNNNETTQANEERSAVAAERTAEATERVAEALESMVPKTITDRENGSTVGWGSLSLGERNTLIAIGKDHPYGGVIRPNPPIKDIKFILYLEGVPAPKGKDEDRVKQTLLMYSYDTDHGEGTDMILVQGHFENVQNIASIPDVLNNNSCCIFYGGCIQEYSCSDPLPKAEKCEPCKPKKEKTCLPCQQQGPGPGKRQADGAAPEQSANGKSKVLPTVDF